MTGILTRLEAFEVRVPLPKPLNLGAVTVLDREYVIVRAYDDAGNVGSAYGLSRNVPIGQTMAALIAPRWVNQPLDAHATFYSATVNANHFLGTNGIFWRCLSLADCALYDLLAVRAGVPLFEYLGGSFKITPTLIAGVYASPGESNDSMVELLEKIAARQPAGIKITSSADYARDTERMAVARRALPDGPPFVADLYCTATNAQSLLQEARKWDAFNMLWLEDPFTFDDFENLAVLADGLPYRVGVGDEQTGVRHFRHLIKHGHIGVARLDATVCGGVRAFIEIAQACAALGVPVSSHVFHFLHSQLAAAVPNHQWVEYMLPESGAESIHLLMAEDLAWRDGGVVPFTKPGIGIAWDEDAIRYYRSR